MNIPSDKHDHLKSLLHDAFKLKEVESIGNHAFAAKLDTGERIKGYDKIAELLTSSSVNQQFNSSHRLLRYLARNQIGKD